MRIDDSPSVQAVFGYGSVALAAQAPPIEAARQARPGSSWSFADQVFGVAIVREARRDPEQILYGADATLKQFGPKSAENADGGSPPWTLGSTGGQSPPMELKAADAEEKALLEKLRARDALVRGHETAHILAAGGQAIGPAQYTYQTGPDGRQYAVGGSVNISIVSSPANDEDSARQAETARRAAMVNGEMSLRDMQVAMRAAGISARSRSRAVDAYAGQADFEQA